MNVNAIPLFASPLISFEVEENTDKLIEYPYEFIKTGTHHKTYATKDNRILQKFSKIEKVLLDYFINVAADVFKYDETFKISTSWVTKTDDTFSQFHNHKHSFYSGVYYFEDYPEDSGKLQFKSPLTYYSDFYLIPKEYNLMNRSTWSEAPKKNKLIFFPSYLEHRVIDNNHIGRRSLAFNIVPTGQYGYGDSSYNTSWFE